MKIIRKNNKIKKLEWNDSLIDVYPHHAFITAILGESDYNMPLLFNHYIQIVYDKGIVRSDFNIALHIQDFVRLLPMMYSHSLSRSLVKSKWNSFTKFLIDMIDDGYYVHCLVDTYYISAYKDTYHNSHFWHNITIYGYNQQEKEFYVADSFYNGKFEKSKASFDEIEKSFIDTFKDDWLDGILLLKLKEDPYVGVGYAPELMQKEIDDYLNGEVTDYITMREKYRRNKEQFVYGVCVFDELVNLIESREEELVELDIRLFYTLKDHVKYILYLIKALYIKGKMQNEEEVYSKFIEIKRVIDKICNLTLKYNVFYNKEILVTIKKLIIEMKQLEIESMKLLRDSMRENKETKMPRFNGCFECDSVYFDYAGEWKEKIVKDQIYYKTSDDSASVKMQFYGNNVAIYAQKSPLYGSMKIVIDEEEHIVNLNSESIENDCKVYSQENLNKGFHSLIIYNNDGNNSSINLKKIEVISDGNINNDECTANFHSEKVGALDDWSNSFGKKGYDIIGLQKKLPWYINEMSYIYRNSVYVLLMRNSTDKRALNYFDNKDKRMVSFNLSDKQFEIDLVLSEGSLKKVTFYCVDHDQLGRKFIIKFLDGNSKKELFNYMVNDCKQGLFLTFMLKGYVRIVFENIEGPDAVLSGVFFD